MAIQTRVCHVLGIAVPVLQAGMASYTNAELVAAVSNAGGLGILGSVNRSPDEVTEEVGKIRALTDRPFGINIVIADATPDQWDACLELRPPVLNTAWGDVAPFIDRIKGAGCRVIHQVNTVAGAQLATRAGVDIVIAQGTEGGGHVGQIGTIALVPQVVNAVTGLPVVAAGGIVDGRGMAAALALGAEGVLVGTRFLASIEAPIADAWKQALVDSSAEQTVLTDIPDIVWDVDWPGATCRVLRNRLVDAWEGRENVLHAQAKRVAEEIAAARERGDDDYVPLYAGQGAGGITAVMPASDIVRGLVAEAAVTIARLQGIMIA